MGSKKGENNSAPTCLSLLFRGDADQAAAAFVMILLKVSCSFSCACSGMR